MLSAMIVVVVAFGSLAATLAAGWSPKLGLDLAGGFSVVYKPVQHATTSELNETVTILSNRVNGLGVSGATVSTQGNEIVVSVPGVKNARTVLKVLGQTAQLYFRPTFCYAPPTPRRPQRARPPPRPPRPSPPTAAPTTSWSRPT